MTGLTDASLPSDPLVFDGPANVQGTYTNVVGAKGSIWGGTKAVCIRLDNSGAVETLNVTTPTAANIKGTNKNGNSVNLLDPAVNDNLGATNKVILPNLNSN